MGRASQRCICGPVEKGLVNAKSKDRRSGPIIGFFARWAALYHKGLNTS